METYSNTTAGQLAKFDAFIVEGDVNDTFISYPINFQNQYHIDHRCGNFKTSSRTRPMIPNHEYSPCLMLAKSVYV